MRDIKVKVCGMRQAGNILEVSALRPDFMGFIFYRESPRYVGDDFEMPIMPEGVKRVGVFVNESTEEILRKVYRFGLDFVQLHGTETPEQCMTLKERGVGVIKVFSIGETMDFAVTEKYVNAVDYFLFDTKGKYYGGNARRFNWSVLSAYDRGVPFFLSGGIGLDHIGDLLEFEHKDLAAIDINSGVEVLPGLKDANKIKTIQFELNAKR
jgi:phosphoribosylanthranilate isomerase